MIPIARTPAQVQAEMLSLTPDGFASSHDPDDYLSVRYLPPATEMAQIEASALSMLPQIDPRQAPDLLPDWQRMLGPDPCVAGVTLDTVTQGQIAYERLTNAGTICAGYFERMALAIGETIAIAEFPPPELGLMQCGASMLVQAPEHCAFKVSLDATEVTHWICGATQCGESLGTFRRSVMECVIRNGAPLYATPYFSYTA